MFTFVVSAIIDACCASQSGKVHSAVTFTCEVFCHGWRTIETTCDIVTYATVLAWSVFMVFTTASIFVTDLLHPVCMSFDFLGRVPWNNRCEVFVHWTGWALQRSDDVFHRTVQK